MKKEITLSNVLAYIQGHIREWLFYSKRWNRLLPLHVYEQINYRIFIMNKTCYENGECVLCGCATPALQMANKTCKGACYPIMMNKKDWNIYKREYNIQFNYWNISKPREFELRISTKKIKK